MNNADLSCWLREYSPDRLREAIELIGSSDQGIFHTTGLHVSQYSHPIGRRLILTQPHAQHLFKAILTQAYSDVDRFVDRFTVLPDLVNTIPSIHTIR